MQKIRIIFLPFLLINVVSVIFWGSLKWVLDVKLNILNLDEFVFGFLVPGILSFFIVSIILGKRVYILRGNSRNNVRELFLLFATLIITATSFTTQLFIGKYSYKLKTVNSIHDIDIKSPVRYYDISNMDIQTDSTLTYTRIHTSGRFSHTLNFDKYYVVPILAYTTTHKHLFWIGQKYHDNTNNNAPLDKKDETYHNFIRHSQNSFDRYTFHKPVYYENLPYSSHRKGYYNAISTKYDIPQNKLFILEPVDEPFNQRYRSSLIGFLISFVGGSVLFFAMVLFDPVNKYSLILYKNNNKIIRDDFFNDAIRALTPRAPHLQTSLIINLILICFIYAMSKNVDFESPSYSDMERLGAISLDALRNGEYWRIFASIFTHAGALHLMSNTLGLGITGYLIERHIRGYWFTIAFFTFGILASLISFLFLPDTHSVGASGAIYGLFGIMVALLFRKKIICRNKSWIHLCVVFFGNTRYHFGFFIRRCQ